MSNKGGRKHHLKRLAAPKKIKIPRKAQVWLTRGRPGAHKLKESVPLVVIIRDYLRYARTSKEAEKIIKQNKVMVDKRVITEPKHTVGFMDLIEFPETKEQFRVTLDKKGRIVLSKVEKAVDFKLCRIVGKKVLGKDKTQINFHDNKNILVKQDTYKVGDVLKLKLPKLEVEKHLKLEKGSLAYITEGKHAGQIAKVKDIQKGSIQRVPNVILTTDEKEYSTKKENIFIIGKDKPEIQTLG